MIAHHSSDQLPKHNIRAIRISSIKQSVKNPFLNKTKHISHIQSCKFHSLEYYNYKPANEDPPIDYEASHMHHSEDSVLLRKEKKQLMLSDTEDMLMEIQLNTSLSPEMEKELQAISKFKRITSQDIVVHQIRLPCAKHDITLFLDLDETLICAQRSPFSKEIALSRVYITKYYNSKLETSSLVHFAVRPFFREFLQSVSANFEIAVFTASDKDYADSIIDIIDPDHLITYRLYRTDCILRNMHYIKDLRIVNRDLKYCIAIDNSLIAFMEQLSNLIPIPIFQGSNTDTALLEIASFLDTIKHASDVREPLKAKYCLTQIYDHLTIN